MQRVLILGAGRVGVEVAAQCALFGKDVVLYDIANQPLGQVAVRLSELRQTLLSGRYVDDRTWEEATPRIACTTNLAGAADAELVIECVPEILEVKRSALASAAAQCRPDAILTTNSSYILPSSLAAAAAHPQRFAGFHFHVPVWRTRIVDIMPHGRTSEPTIERLAEFAAEIGMVPIRLRKEAPGYLFNSLLLPLLFQAVHLARRDVASMEDIDRAWMGVTGMPLGPFGMLDVIGLKTAQQVAANWADLLHDRSARQVADFLQAKMESAVATEPTFYQYPQPSYAQPGFLPECIRPVDRSSRAAATPYAAAIASGLLRLVGEWIVAPSQRGEPAVASSASPFCICGTGPITHRLGDQLRSSGVSIACLDPFLQSAAPPGWDDFFREQRFDRLIVLASDSTSRRPLGDHSCPAREDEIVWAYRLIQAWYQAWRERQSAESAQVVLLLPDGAGPWWQGLRGLAKSLFIEAAARGSSVPSVKVISLAGAPHDPDVIHAVCEECRRPDPTAQSPVDRHAGIDLRLAGGARWVFRYRDASSSCNPAADLPSGQWVFSGGARGITAVCALALAKQFPVSLHLLGRSTLPEIDYSAWSPAEVEALRADVMKRAFAQRRKPNVAWNAMAAVIEAQRNLRKLRQEGIAARYHACDVADPSSLAKTLDAIRAAGPIRGVVHGAGVEVTGSFERKSLDTLRSTLRAKVAGTSALLELTRSDPLQSFVAFASLSGRFGGFAQTDYALANEAMAGMVRAAAADRSPTRFVTIHWPGWREVGMAARPESARRIAAAGLHCLEPDVGAAIFMDEIRFANHDRDVTICHASDLPAVWLADEKSPAMRQPE